MRAILMIPSKMMTQRQTLVCHSRMGTLTAMPIYDNLGRCLPTTKLLQCNGCNNMRLRRHCLRQDRKGGQKRHNQNNVQKPSKEQLLLNGGAFTKQFNVNNNKVLLLAAQQANKDIHNGNLQELHHENQLTMKLMRLFEGLQKTGCSHNLHGFKMDGTTWMLWSSLARGIGW
jgi:hypothetical protein